jgi:hypothetical protein
MPNRFPQVSRMQVTVAGHLTSWGTSLAEQYRLAGHLPVVAAQSRFMSPALPGKTVIRTVQRTLFEC